MQNESIRDLAYNDANKLVTSQPVRTGIRDRNLVEKRDNMDIYFGKNSDPPETSSTRTLEPYLHESEWPRAGLSLIHI